jgi:uroporphyrinogen III methyltransferase/synthase
MNRRPGIVYLVGAGPGDPGLITVRGRELLRCADVVVHDRLIASKLLAEVRRGAESVDVGKAPGAHRASQDQINAILVNRAAKGLMVVRLKGGDPFVFGRGCEEVAACRAAGIECVTVSGVSSALAAPASAGVSLTERGGSRCFAVVTAETATGDQPVDFANLVGVDTLVIMMGRERLAQITHSLIVAGRDPEGPAACIERGTTAAQRVVTSTLGTIARRADEEGLHAPIVTVIGEAARTAELRTSAESAPLLGKRIVSTRPRTTSLELERALTGKGAIVVACPLIRIEYPRDESVSHRPWTDYAWIAFTSRHGVIGFWKRLRTKGEDSRALAACKLAAVGQATAKALRRIGVVPNLICTDATGKGLARELLAASIDSNRRILLPRGDLAMRTPVSDLRAGGAIVDEWIVYQTRAAKPTADARGSIESGADAILFFSPSAVRSCVEAGLPAGDAAVACVGPTTAQAARTAGLRVDVIAEQHSALGLVAALEAHLQLVGVEP